MSTEPKPVQAHGDVDPKTAGAKGARRSASKKSAEPAAVPPPASAPTAAVAESARVEPQILFASESDVIDIAPVDIPAAGAPAEVKGGEALPVSDQSKSALFRFVGERRDAPERPKPAVVLVSSEIMEAIENGEMMLALNQ